MGRPRSISIHAAQLADSDCPSYRRGVRLPKRLTTRRVGKRFQDDLPNETPHFTEELLWKERLVYANRHRTLVGATL